MAAMLHGLPVIGTRGSMTDKLWAGVEGVTLLPRACSATFARAALGLAENKDMRIKHGHLNKEYYEANFSWENIVNIFMKAIQ